MRGWPTFTQMVLLAFAVLRSPHITSYLLLVVPRSGCAHDFSGQDEELRRVIQTHLHVLGEHTVTGLLHVNTVTSIYSTVGYLSIGIISLI